MVAPFSHLVVKKNHFKKVSLKGEARTFLEFPADFTSFLSSPVCIHMINLFFAKEVRIVLSQPGIFLNQKNAALLRRKAESMRDRQSTMSLRVTQLEFEQGLSPTNGHALSCLPCYFLSEKTLKLTSHVNETMVSPTVKQHFSYTRMAAWFL